METYTFIIEGSPSSASTLNVMLALGKYSTSYTTGLTTGYAVFDNLSLTKLDDGEEYKAAVESERNATDLATLTTRTTTLKVSNGRFDFGTTTLSSSGTPNGWSLVTGNSGNNDSAPSSLGYNAVIDVSKFADNYENIRRPTTQRRTPLLKTFLRPRRQPRSNHGRNPKSSDVRSRHKRLYAFATTYDCARHQVLSFNHH